MTNIILFDGYCHFCDHSVQFIIKRDKKAVFNFASIQSDTGEKVFNKFNIPASVDSLVLVQNDKCHFKSSAALRICRNLKGLWKLGYCLLVIPKPLRDYVYDIVAKNRYKWFGKRDSCMLPPPEVRNRFLE